jgi:hypothetical protein
MGGPHGLAGLRTSDNLFRLKMHRVAVILGRLGHFRPVPVVPPIVRKHAGAKIVCHQAVFQIGRNPDSRLAPLGRMCL